MERRESLTCVVEGCTNSVAVKSRGLCDRHYTRWRRHGNPLHVTRVDTRGLSLGDKLRAHGWDEVPGTLDTTCWVWRGRKPGQRYGKVRVDGQSVGSHRVAYEAWVGPIPEGHLVRHRCDNPPCINPTHLDTGTCADNSNDMVERRRTQDQRGELGPRAVLTDADVLTIRARYAAGELQRVIGADYDLTQTAISAIVRKRTWAHI